MHIKDCANLRTLLVILYFFIACAGHHPEEPASNASTDNRERKWPAKANGTTENRGCPKDHELPCVPKCCDVYDSYGTNKECTASGDYFLPEFVDCPNSTESMSEIPLEYRYEYFVGDPCRKDKYILDISEYPEDEYYLYSNGTLWYGYRLLTMEEFCVESVNGTPRVFVCFDTLKEGAFQFYLYPIGLLLSIPFLFLTAAVYLGFEDLRDVQGKTLSCHVTCLAIAYFFLALVQLASNDLNGDVCIAAAFIIQFFFVASFFWLNVLCFDTWRNIRTNCMRSLTRDGKSETMKFFYYSIYAWYGPCALTIVSLIMDLEPTIPESLLKPKFGFHSCWFQSDAAALPYFYGPIGILIFINIIFFILSITKIHSEQNNYVKLKRTNSHGLDSDIKFPPALKVYVRMLERCFSLFCVMGINWAAEVISWIIGGSDLVWLITDIFNTLQGLVIFYIFVMKPLCVRERVIRKFQSIIGCSGCTKDSGEEPAKDKKLQPEAVALRKAFAGPKDGNFRYIDASAMSLDNL